MKKKLENLNFKIVNKSWKNLHLFRNINRFISYRKKKVSLIILWTMFSFNLFMIYVIIIMQYECFSIYHTINFFQIFIPLGKISKIWPNLGRANFVLFYCSSIAAVIYHTPTGWTSIAWTKSHNLAASIQTIATPTPLWTSILK